MTIEDYIELVNVAHRLVLPSKIMLQINNAQTRQTFDPYREKIKESIIIIEYLHNKFKSQSPVQKFINENKNWSA